MAASRREQREKTMVVPANRNACDCDNIILDHRPPPQRGDTFVVALDWSLAVSQNFGVLSVLP